MRRKAERVATFDCGDGAHVVTTLKTIDDSGVWSHCRKPCAQCPWRRDLPTGVFPASAFRHSAATAYDMAQTTFACHMSGVVNPATCAGFLMVSADDNLSIRLAILFGRYDLRDVSDGGFPLYQSYRAMAVANGVDKDDPALKPCRQRKR